MICSVKSHKCGQTKVANTFSKKKKSRNVIRWIQFLFGFCGYPGTSNFNVQRITNFNKEYIQIKTMKSYTLRKECFLNPRFGVRKINLGKVTYLPMDCYLVKHVTNKDQNFGRPSKETY